MRINYPNAIAMRYVNMFDSVIFYQDRGRSIMEGMVVGITIRGVHVSTPDAHLFVKWSDVREVDKQSKIRGSGVTV